MFGKKRIKQLEEERDGYKTIVESEGPYISLAKSMHERVAAKLASLTSDDIDLAFTAAVAATEADLLASSIEAKIHELPVEKLLGMYARLLGDDSVNEPLKRVAEIERVEAERKARIKAIKHESKVSQQLDLRNIQEGENRATN